MAIQGKVAVKRDFKRNGPAMRLARCVRSELLHPECAA
jgi:hypothetical protein